MMNNRLNYLNSLYLGVVLTVLLIAAIYGENNYYYWSGFVLFLLIFSSEIIIFFWTHFIEGNTPVLLKTLSGVSQSLSPIANYLGNSKIIGPIISWFVRAIFFFWFLVLLIGDVLIRAILSKSNGIHEGTGVHFSPLNASDPNFQPLGSFEKDEETEKNRKLYGDYFPNYNKKLALLLALASKIAYEDVPIIVYELKKAGYNMESFKPIAYKNICGYIAEKDDNIILVFRGTNPLNIQNWLTDIRALLCKIELPNQDLTGLVHEGCYEAIGEDLSIELSRSQTQTIIELSNTSLVNTMGTIFGALKTLVFFAFQSIITHVHDPVDHRYIGEDVRFISAYTQATTWISKLCEKSNNEAKEMENTKLGNEDEEQQKGERKLKKRLYIAGQSLGGGLATVFLAKLLINNSPLLDIFAGMYTFGQPNVGDINFAKAFGPELGKKMFNHAYNNDVVSRLPTWKPYSNPPGNLVFIDSSFSIYLYPPDPITNIPIPLRGISYLELSGLLNINIIRRMRNESWLRIFYRFIFPFFVNDHFPGDYIHAIREGTIERVIVGIPGQIGGIEKS
ncbi:Alpha/Beta hydrolase protein [Glomus cerebriforme]|uniref:Alpha/Beta hydrolase protein n=1 Tax=Glomus cerebriforme TaxID=658196 RepID=A0A397SLU8_9GLOM|nr:Alpha/Beta hydrolase protein [Glomus cerebriforme]